MPSVFSVLYTEAAFCVVFPLVLLAVTVSQKSGNAGLPSPCGPFEFVWNMNRMNSIEGNVFLRLNRELLWDVYDI